MTEAELQQQSALILEGEWTGQAPWPGRSDGAQRGTIAVSRQLSGSLEGAVVQVLRPPAGRPVSSSDLEFRRGDRGLWFLKAAPGEAKGVFIVDHPQRFLRDAPENAAELKAWHERLKR